MVNEVVEISAIEKLQAQMLELPQVELETNHYFANGVYAREGFLPAGMLIVGKVHKMDHMFMLLKGRVAVSNEGGTDVIVAPAVVVAKAGTKRAIYAFEDSVWVNVHRTNETDIEKIEDELVVPDPTSPFLPGNKLNPLLQGSNLPKVEKQ